MTFFHKKNILVIIILLTALIICTYFFASTNRNSGISGLNSLRDVEFKNTGVRFIPAGWREFRSELYGFSILYKDELAIKEFPESGGASVFTFENTSRSVGFQLFVVPYGEEKISQERFLKDSPLGVRENSRDLKVDKVVATSFYGRDEALGNTYEVWFIHNGLLYEASTLKPLEVWLLDIIDTWLFL